LPVRPAGKLAGVLLVTNELAGRAEHDAVAAAAAVLEAAGPVEWLACHVPGDLDAILDRRGERAIVVVGGDGSLHTVLGTLWRRGETADCPVGLIPLGTGNDFARGVGIPLDPVAAADLIVAGHARPADLITDDGGGVVVNAMHVGVGADAAVRARPLKRYLKIGAFPVGGLLAGMRAPGWRLRIEVDGHVVASGRQRILMAGLANAPSIAGGTAVLAPGASVTDGLIDVIVSTAVGAWQRLGYGLRLMRGTHAERADVVRLTGRTLAISGQPFYTNADGEIAGPYRRRVWTVQPGAWRCFLPAVTPTMATPAAAPVSAQPPAQGYASI
jgi:diacylglycerol kinase (ATP)